MRRGLAALAAPIAVLLLVATGCSDDPSAPGESRVDVDTPELRELKADAGIEPCVPGAGDGGLPELTLACLGGGPDVDLATLEGPLLVNLWFSACGPCEDEMPALQQFHEKYADQVPLIGIDISDVDPKSAIALAELTGATYPQLADPGGELFDLEEPRIANGFPQFILLGADGTVVVQAPGGLDSLDEIVDLVESNLGLTL